MRNDERSEIAKITDILTEAYAKEINQLEEHIFVGVWLPLFHKGESPYGVTLNQWASFAGGGNREVAIIDRNGAVLFNVPSIIDSSLVAPKSDYVGVSMYDAVQTAHQLTLQHPTRGENYINNVLSSRMTAFHDNPSAIERAKRWNDIFGRYGIEPITATVTTATTPSDSVVGAENTNPGIVDEWEEL